MLARGVGKKEDEAHDRDHGQKSEELHVKPAAADMQPGRHAGQAKRDPESSGLSGFSLPLIPRRWGRNDMLAPSLFTKWKKAPDFPAAVVRRESGRLGAVTK
jgi:hypothetical protein